MAGILSGLLGCNKPAKTEYVMADNYRYLRSQALGLDPTKIGLDSSSSNRVWGLLMETGYPEAVASSGWVNTMGHGRRSTICYLLPRSF